MEAPEFRDFAKEMVDYIANYLENIRDRWVTATAAGNSPINTLIIFIHKVLDGEIPLWINVVDFEWVNCGDWCEF